MVEEREGSEERFLKKYEISLQILHRWVVDEVFDKEGMVGLNGMGLLQTRPNENLRPRQKGGKCVCPKHRSKNILFRISRSKFDRRQFESKKWSLA